MIRAIVVNPKCEHSSWFSDDGAGRKASCCDSESGPKFMQFLRFISCSFAGVWRELIHASLFFRVLFNEVSDGLEQRGIPCRLQIQ